MTAYLVGNPEKMNLGGSSIYVWSEEAIFVHLATLSPAVGRVGCECYGDTTPLTPNVPS